MSWREPERGQFHNPRTLVTWSSSNMIDFIFQNGPWVSILIVSTIFVLAAWVVLNFVRLGHNDRSPIEAPVEFEDQPYDEIFERGVENQPNQWMSSADRSDGNKSPDDCPK